VSLVLTEARVSRILTRSSGFLRTVSSHSLQPYRGCTFGGTLCGVGCYVRDTASAGGDVRAPAGSRTLATPLPQAMACVDATSVGLDYRDRMVAVAEEVMPGRVGVSVDGFAGRFRPAR